jgi:formylglycine-generating enzyme required for sulfatase activity
MNAISHSNIEAREQRVAEAPTDNFAELIRIAGLDPEKHLRFADWSGVDFGGCDLRGLDLGDGKLRRFDFTGARLIGCNFEGARIEGARFDQALIDEVKAPSSRGEERAVAIQDAIRDPGLLRSARNDEQLRPGAKIDPNRTNLRAAKDWDKQRKNWKRADKTAPEYLPQGAVFQDAPFAPEMVVIPPGRFTMGSPDDEKGRYDDDGPQHEVRIPRALAVGRFAVTFEEWDFAQDDKDWASATGMKPRKPDDEKWGRDRRPVIDVSWNDAKAYAAWLTHRTGQAYRLLSEAEWEYAARAGTAKPFWWGGAITPEQANYNGNYLYEGGGAKGEYREKTVPVDSFEPNPWGLYQVHGNVWEWCEDAWHESYKDKPEELKLTGAAWTTGDSSSRVLRGGSWSNSPAYLRAAVRFRIDAAIRYNDSGFRVARTLNP